MIRKMKREKALRILRAYRYYKFRKLLARKIAARKVILISSLKLYFRFRRGLDFTRKTWRLKRFRDV